MSRAAALAVAVLAAADGRAGRLIQEVSLAGVGGRPGDLSGLYGGAVPRATRVATAVALAGGYAFDDERQVALAWELLRASVAERLPDGSRETWDVPAHGLAVSGRRRFLLAPAVSLGLTASVGVYGLLNAEMRSTRSDGFLEVRGSALGVTAGAEAEWRFGSQYALVVSLGGRVLRMDPVRFGGSLGPFAVPPGAVAGGRAAFDLSGVTAGVAQRFYFGDGGKRATIEVSP